MQAAVAQVDTVLLYQGNPLAVVGLLKAPYLLYLMIVTQSLSALEVLEAQILGIQQELLAVILYLVL